MSGSQQPIPVERGTQRSPRWPSWARHVWRIPTWIVVLGMLYVVTNRLLLPVLEGHAVDPDMLVLDLLVVPLAAVMTLALLVRHEESRSRANEALRQSEE